MCAKIYKNRSSPNSRTCRAFGTLRCTKWWQVTQRRLGRPLCRTKPARTSRIRLRRRNQPDPVSYRYLDGVEMRWLTRDPIGYQGGVNLYGYVRNNPINAVDPTGLDTLIFRGEFVKWFLRHYPRHPDSTFMVTKNPRAV